MRNLIAILFLAAILPASAQFSERWNAAADRPAPRDITVMRGETLAVEPLLTVGGAAVDLAGTTATFYWQTNGMDAAWWSSPATVSAAETGRVSAVWSHTNDVGAAAYTWFIGLDRGGTATAYRAFGRIAMRASPGWQPNTVPLPVLAIDFSRIQLQNAPWLLQADWQSASNTLAGTIAQHAEKWQIWLDTNTYVRAEQDSAALDALDEYAATNRLKRLYAWSTSWVEYAGENIMQAFTSTPAPYWHLTGSTESLPLTYPLAPIEETNGWFCGYGFATMDYAVVTWFDGTHDWSLESGPVYIHGTTNFVLHNRTTLAHTNVLCEVFPDVPPRQYYLSDVPLVGPRLALIEGDTNKWSTAYGWGNHALAGYLTAFTEADPLAGPRLALIEGETNKWRMAYSWGNHALSGYASTSAVAAATNAIVQTYLVGSNAWITVDFTNATISVTMIVGNTTNTVTASQDVQFDPSATNALWTALVSGLAAKADKAWGSSAPDGSANPDPSYMTWLNAPATLFASGASWSTYGTYAVLVTTGTVAYASGGDGSLRIGPDSTNHFGFTVGGSVLVGSVPDSLSVHNGGQENGWAEITYAYAGGDFPVLMFTPTLAVDFSEVTGAAWTDNLDGTATVTAPALSAAGFFKATTTLAISSVFESTMPAKLTGGVIGNTNAVPVVYDSVITVSSGGHTYRIPAELVE